MTLADIMYLDRSGTSYPLDDPRWRGSDGSPLRVSSMTGLTRADVDRAERSMWRYQKALPVDPAFRVSLGEGWTPLVWLPWSADRQTVNIGFKLEWFNPTSSFKDRGASALITHMRSLGASRILEDSSGNGGAAIAAYAAAAGLQAKILAPSATSMAKTLQASAFGAEVELVNGSRDDVSAEAVRQSEQIAYASHNWHPMFIQGTKTIGYEIWEQLAFSAPDNVVVVAGAGSNVLGCDLAFSELVAAGEIERTPRLLVGQPRGWSTIVDTCNGVVDSDLSEPSKPSLAEGASIRNPVRLAEVVSAIRRSNGVAVAVGDDEIRGAMRRLGSFGLFAEPTSAVAAAALDRFIDDGTIGACERTVVVLTGSGLKATEAAAHAFA